MSPISVFLAVIIALGGGASIAAEQAQPGDALYPYKTSVNESVRSAVSFGTEAEANWSIRKAERRLGEAEELASESKLDSESQAKIKNEFSLEAKKTRDHISRLLAEGKERAAFEVASEFEASLSDHQSALAKIEAGNPLISDIKADVTQEIGVMASLQAAMTNRGEANGNAQDDEMDDHEDGMMDSQNGTQIDVGADLLLQKR